MDESQANHVWVAESARVSLRSEPGVSCILSAYAVDRRVRLGVARRHNHQMAKDQIEPGRSVAAGAAQVNDDRTYANVFRLAEIVEKDVRRRVEGAITELDDPFLVRGQIAAARIKSQRSLQRKARNRRRLAEADAIAEQIRRDVARPRRGRRVAGGQPLTAAAAAFLYREKWGENPPEYVVQAVMRELEGGDIRTDGLAVALADQALIERLIKAYSEGSGRYQFDADIHQIFRWIANGLVRGTDAAVREARRDGRGEAASIDGTARHEALSDIEGPEDIIDALEYAQKDEDPASDVERWADGLDALSKCSMCGAAGCTPA